MYFGNGPMYSMDASKKKVDKSSSLVYFSADKQILFIFFPRPFFKINNISTEVRIDKD